MTKETEMKSNPNPKEKTSRIVQRIKKSREKKGAAGVVKEPLIILVIFEIRGAYFALKGLDVSEIIPIKKIADYTCSKKGGEGAFRELADLIISSKK